jgi:hypothetical protein
LDAQASIYDSNVLQQLELQDHFVVLKSSRRHAPCPTEFARTCLRIVLRAL